MRSASLFFLVLGPALRLAAQTAPAPTPAPTVNMDQVVVTATQSAQLNSIDRKIYTVGNDIQASTGSAADVLQNIPSVDVDIDGNVSLRGDPSVQILIDGQPSALTGAANQADLLSQLPADSIERIEVITNPSAMFKPDGTGGIINIVLKKKRAKGYSGSVRVTVGNDHRFGLSATGNYNPGPYNLSGSYTVRQDHRPRSATDRRSYLDPTTGLPATTESQTSEEARLLTQLGELGLDFKTAPEDSLKEVVDVYYRIMSRFAIEHDTVNDPLGTVASDYQRVRVDPENEGDVNSKSTYQHNFGRDDDTLTLNLQVEHYAETDRDSYTNVYAVPPGPNEPEYLRITDNEPYLEAKAEYSNVISANSKLNLGLDWWDDKVSENHLDLLPDPVTGQLESHPLESNLFVVDQKVTALYGTYQHAWGSFGAMAGAREEASDLETDQITSGVTADQTDLRFYPSLHLTYDLSDTRQLQLNYSHRVRRPESDDLNPYPSYVDPYNLSAGNPYLKPEETHSVEAGYQYKRDDTTYLGTLFYRYSYDSFTQVSQYISSTTLLTTQENLGESQSGGLELVANGSPVGRLTLNGSSDIYYNQIDASNLGYSTRQSTIAWSAKLDADYALSKISLLQFTCNYAAKRLTPQGYREPSFVANFGFKHEFKSKNLSLVATVSDVFNSLKEETKLNTPVLQDDYTRRRSARIFSLGLVYTFGTTKAKAKGDVLEYDNQP